MSLVSLGADVKFPDDQDPEYRVESIEGGYKFVFTKDDTLSFSIGEEVIEKTSMATGYEGKQGEAIETFRAYGKDKWPERFHN